MAVALGAPLPRSKRFPVLVFTLLPLATHLRHAAKLKTAKTLCNYTNDTPVSGNVKYQIAKNERRDLTNYTNMCYTFLVRKGDRIWFDRKGA